MNNAKSLGEIVLRLHKIGKWQKNWVVVSELIRAQSSTIAISNSSKGKLELTADGFLSKRNAQLADLNGKFAVVSHSDLAFKMVAEAHTTPLFKAMGIRTFFGINPKFRGKSMMLGNLGFDVIPPILED